MREGMPPPRKKKKGAGGSRGKGIIISNKEGRRDQYRHVGNDITHAHMMSIYRGRGTLII